MLRALLILLFALPAIAEESLPPGAVARIGSTRMRHTAEVGALAYSPDGKLLAAADAGGAIHLYEAATGRVVRRLTFAAERELVNPGGSVIEIETGEPALCFAKDGHRLYAAVRHTVWAFRLDTGELAFKWTLNEQVLALGSDLTVATVGQSLVIYQLDPADGRTRKRHVIEGSRPARAEATAHGVLSSARIAARLIDAASGKHRATLVWNNAGVIAGSTLAPDGDSLAVTIDPGKDERASLEIWDVRDPKQHRTIAGVSAPSPVAFAPDGKSLAVGCREGLLLIDPASGKVLRAAEAAPRFKRLAFSPDGKVLAAASGGAVSQWDAATGKRLPASAEPAGDIVRLQFIDGGRMRVYAGEIAEYDWRTNSVTKRLPVPPHTHPGGDDVSRDGSLIAACDTSAVRVVDASTGRVKHDVAIDGAECTFSPDGSRLFVLGGPTSCEVLHTATGQRRRLVDGSWGVVHAGAVSPDGTLLVGRMTPGNDAPGVIRLWNSTTGNKVRDLFCTCEDVGEPGFSTGGRWVGAVVSIPAPADASPDGANFGALVWDPTSGRLVRAFRDLRFATANWTLWRHSVAFGAQDGVVHVWEIAGGVERVVLKGHAQPISTLHFSKCGRYLATSSPGAPVLIWDLFAPPPGPAPPPARMWADLARDAQAFEVMRRLVAAPDVAIALCRQNVRPAVPIAEERLTRLLTDLDDRRFATRAAASSELRRVVDQVEARLARLAAAPDTSTEARRMLRLLLERIDQPDGESLTHLRALEVLEHINTPAARKLIEEFAAGAPAARFTVEARAALERMKR